MAEKLNVAIAGGGIGGLATASFLRDQGHDVTIFDAYDTPSPIGSGLIVQPSGQAVLSKLGLLPKAMDLGAKITRLEGYRVPDEKKVLFAQYHLSDDSVFGLGMHRGALFQILLNAALDRGVTIKSSHMVLGIDIPHDPYLSIEGARQAGPFDLVVNASGASARLSNLLPRDLPFGALWGVVDLPEGEDLGTVLRQRYRRANQMAGIMPLGRLQGETTQKAAVFWSMRVSDYDDWRNHDLSIWKADVAAFWPAFEEFIETITTHDQVTFATYAHGSLRKTHKARVVHIGDAAHQASPQLGQGANLALLDALVLADAIATYEEVPDALEVYSKTRRNHVRVNQLLSALFTPLYQSDTGALAMLRDYVLAPLSMSKPIRPMISRILRGELIRPTGLVAQKPGRSAMKSLPEPGE